MDYFVVFLRFFARLIMVRMGGFSWLCYRFVRTGGGIGGGSRVERVVLFVDGEFWFVILFVFFILVW